MPVFIQLSKIQKKLHARAEASNRRMRAHEAAFPSKEDREAVRQALENEVKALAAQQAIDAAATATPIEVARTNNIIRNNAIKAQGFYKAVRRTPVTP